MKESTKKKMTICLTALAGIIIVLFIYLALLNERYERMKDNVMFDKWTREMFAPKPRYY